MNRWSRPLWKIHGSPFVLACPRCGGHTRWKTSTPLEIGQPCPAHPDQRLVPEITFWGQSIDVAYPRVWKTVKARLQRCDMIVGCGFSGSGSDIYIRRVIESTPNAWVVNPGPGAWDTTRIRFVEGYASDLAAGLWAAFVTRH